MIELLSQYLVSHSTSFFVHNLGRFWRRFEWSAGACGKQLFTVHLLADGELLMAFPSPGFLNRRVSNQESGR